MATIFICMHCGERMTGKNDEVKPYCTRCKTAEGRKKIDEENEEIRKELKISGEVVETTKEIKNNTTVIEGGYK